MSTAAYTARDAPAIPKFARRNWRTAILAIGTALVGTLILHGATVLQAVSVWNRSVTYQYAWIVLPTFIYLLWHNRQRLAQREPAASVLGILAASASGFLWLAGELMNIAAASQLALVAAICAIVLAGVGWPTFRRLLPFLAMLVFLVPAGSVLLHPLKTLTVGILSAFATVTGLPFSQEGFTIFVGTQRYVVIDDCAGLPYLLWGLFLGLTLALLIYRSWWKIAALTCLGGVLAIVANGLRVIGIITYDYLIGSEMSLSEHGYFELLAVGLSFSLLFVIFARLRREPPTKVEEHVDHLPRPTGLKIVGAVLLAAMFVVIPLFIWQAPADVSEQRFEEPMLPAEIAGWVKTDRFKNDWKPSAQRDAATTTRANYQRGGRRLSLLVAHARSWRNEVSGGGINLVGDSKWMPGLQRELSVCAGDRCERVRYLKLLLRDSDRVRHVYTVYVLGAHTTASAIELRLRRAWAKFKGAPSETRLIAVSTDIADGLSAEDIVKILRSLTKQLAST